MPIAGSVLPFDTFTDWFARGTARRGARAEASASGAGTLAPTARAADRGRPPTLGLVLARLDWVADSTTCWCSPRRASTGNVAGSRSFWTWKSRRSTGRPTVPADVSASSARCLRRIRCGVRLASTAEVAEARDCRESVQRREVPGPCGKRHRRRPGGRSWPTTSSRSWPLTSSSSRR